MTRVIGYFFAVTPIRIYLKGIKTLPYYLTLKAYTILTLKAYSITKLGNALTASAGTILPCLIVNDPLLTNFETKCTLTHCYPLPYYF